MPVYWLLDSRFDFLIPSFMSEFGVTKQDMIFVNSYHSKERHGWNKIYIPFAKKQSVVQMEPDEMNRIFSKKLQLDTQKMVISFSGAGLPENDNLISLMATGAIAEKCNNKWWQYCQFALSGILTPDTYQFHELNEVQEQFNTLIKMYGRVLIKRPELSGGYQMAVLSSESDFKAYQRCIGESKDDFLVSAYISHQQSFASMGIVKKSGGVFGIPVITEQVLYREVAYEGLLFPAFLNEEYKEQIQRKTKKIGEILEKNGYFGFYNVDYILGDDGKLYAIEINARWGFSTILMACLYRERFWKIMQGAYIEEIKYPNCRLAIGKIKAREGRKYRGLESYSDIAEWFKRQSGSFGSFICGKEKEEIFEYGSYIGIFGKFFSQGENRKAVLKRFWEGCLEYY